MIFRIGLKSIWFPQDENEIENKTVSSHHESKK